MSRLATAKTTKQAPVSSGWPATFRSRGRLLFVAIFLQFLTACSNGDPSEESIARAKQYLSEADYQAATLELKNALQRNTNSAEARWLLGNMYLQQGDAVSAEKELVKAQELDWSANDVRPNLAKALLAQGKHATVRDMTHSDLEPAAAASLLSVKAVSELAQGNLDEADALLKVALQTKPDLNDVKMAQARILFDRRELASAMAVIEEILTKGNPAPREAWSLQGDILALQGDLKGAVAAYDQCISLLPNSFNDLFKRAVINLEIQNFDAAQADATTLLNLSPQNPAGNYIKGLLAFKNKDYLSSITALTAAEPAALQLPLTLFYLGSANLMQGNLDQAEVFANRYLDLVPQARNAMILLSQIKFQRQDFKGVEEVMQPLLDQNPDDIEVLNIMANTLLSNGKIEQGITLLERVAELEPNSPTAQARLGSGLLASGRSDEAIEPLAAALHLKPEFQQAEIMLVMTHLQKGEFEQAIDAANKYRERHPEAVTSHILLGRVMLASGRTQEAKDSFNRVLSMNPGDISATNNLARLALESKDLSAARQYYTSALEYHSDDLSTLLNLASLDALEAKEESMVKHLERAIEAHPTALEPRVILGRYFVLKKKPEKVAPLFANLNGQQKQSEDVLKLKAQAEVSGGQFQRAQYTLAQLNESSPDTAYNHYMLAMAAAESGDEKRMKDELQASLALDSEYFPSLLALAKLARIEKSDVNFHKYMDKLVKQAPDAAEVLRLRAAAAQADGDSALTVKFARDAFAAAQTRQTMLELASYLSASGDSGESRRLQQKWIEDHPEDVVARLALAEELRLDNAPEQAQLQYEVILKHDPDNIIALNNLAWMLRVNEPAKALKYINHALTLQPDRPDLLDSAAVIEHLNGNQSQAQRNIERALSRDPKNPSMLYHRAMIDAAQGMNEVAIAALKGILVDGTSFPEEAEARALLALLNAKP